MNDRVVHPANGENAEAVLRDQLARGDAMAGTVLPILRHLISAEDSSIFSDEILARIRGMLADLVDGLLGEGAGEQHGDAAARLTRAFIDDPALLSHLHALAMEWQLTERLQARLALDPVLSPLLRSLISSSDAQTQGLAMAFLAVQARWSQSQRRMTLPLHELPGELLHGVLLALRSAVPEMAERAAQVEGEVRRSHDGEADRLGLAARLVTSLGDGSQAALSLVDAGVSLFLTALALRAGQGRDTVVLSTHETQAARLALSLRSTGLDAFRVEEQVLVLHPGAVLPPGFDRVDRGMAAAVIASGDPAGCHGR